MSKSVESVLSEIIGVPSGNVKFTLEGNSMDFYGAKEYSHGLIRCYIEFTTLEPIRSDSNYRFGSLIIGSFEGNKYTAVLVRGKETAMITQAIADMCKVD